MSSPDTPDTFNQNTSSESPSNPQKEPLKFQDEPLNPQEERSDFQEEATEKEESAPREELTAAYEEITEIFEEETDLKEMEGSVPHAHAGRQFVEKVIQTGKTAGMAIEKKAEVVIEKAASALKLKNDSGKRAGQSKNSISAGALTGTHSELKTGSDFSEERTTALEDDFSGSTASGNSAFGEGVFGKGSSGSEKAKFPTRKDLAETIPNGTFSNAEDLTPDGTVLYQEETPDSEKGKKEDVIPTAPPQEIAGYEFDRFLGSGAYGEVWIAVQVSTMRRVAVKFYTHHSQNIEFLTQEVEKLSLLFSDQNVVQLLEVGWDAKTPYYIMEYLEKGSLADAIGRQKSFTIPEAEEMFEVLLRTMVRAHQKGIIHCDLKPGNILMDQNGNPRLADFGQSRLTNDMAPALGTLFFMPPEQAMLHARADVRWDVYALGAIFYSMLMGRPPHYTPSFVEKIQAKHHLPSRMGTYRRLLQNLPVPSDFRQLKGMSLPVSQIIEKCLQPNPDDRFQSMEELLRAWNVCKNRRAKLPLLILGLIMPVLVILIGGFFVISEFQCAFRKGVEIVTDSALVSGKLAAEAVAKNVEYEITRRRSVVEQLAENWQFRDLVQELSDDPQWKDYTQRLGKSDLNDAERMQLQTEFTLAAQRQELQALLETSMPDDYQLEPGDDLIFCDLRGISAARIPFSGLVGLNFLPYLLHEKTFKPGEPFITETRISDVFLDPVLNQWSVAIATPVFSAEEKPVFLGILFMAVDIGNFVETEGTSEHFVTLVDQRPGEYQGLILEHPLYAQIAKEGKKMPETFMLPKLRVTQELLPDTPEKSRNYHDPMAASDYANGQFGERWLAACADVHLGIGDGHWTVITQKSYDRSIGAFFTSIEKHFWWVYLHATAVFLIVIPMIWYFIHRVFILKSRR